MFVTVSDPSVILPVTVWSVVSPDSGETAPPTFTIFAEDPTPSVLVLSKNKSCPTSYPVAGLSIAIS